jgi:hypothetical protein
VTQEGGQLQKGFAEVKLDDILSSKSTCKQFTLQQDEEFFRKKCSLLIEFVILENGFTRNP